MIDIDICDPKAYRIPFEQPRLWKQYLETHGFVVLSNYLPRQTCNQHINTFWNIMQTLSDNKLIPTEQSTHSNSSNYPPVLHGGMIQYVGHSAPQWQLRQQCKPIFACLWDTEDLKCSFDGFCFMNGARKYEKRADDAFLHTDQSPLKDYLWSYQGIMTLTDSGQGQGGFVCIPNTHKYHQQYFHKKNLQSHKKDWYQFPEQDKKKQPLCSSIKIQTQAGDFILFDSRTFHCNTVPMIDNCLRVCTYVCMLPTKGIQERVLEERKKAVAERRTSSHHPGDGFRTFPELPNEASDPQRFRQLIGKVNNFEIPKQMESMI